MRKTVLSIIAAASFITASAAVPTLTENWSKSLTGINESPNYVTPVKTDATGAVIATGTFDTDFEFAKNTLEALGTSSYILKYAADGTPAWGVALTGAATISAVDTDTDGNVYVAGTFADKVVFNTTSGEPITKMGMTVDGAATTKLNASFIAKYSADGKVEAVETFIPEYLPELVESGIYFPEDGDVQFTINNLAVSDAKVYASALFTGKTTKGNTTFEGSYYDAWGGGFLYMDMDNAAVFSLNTKDLSECTKEAALTLVAPTFMAMEKAINANLLVVDGQLYAGFVGVGTFNLSFGSSSKEVTFTPDGDTGNNEYGYAIISANGSVSVSTISDASQPVESIASLIMNDGNLYAVATTDGTGIPGSVTEQTITGSSEIFVLTIDPATMTLKGSNPYSYNAGGEAEKENFEVALDAAPVGNALYINFREFNFNHELIGAKSVIFDGTAFTEAPVAATGVSTADKAVAFGQVTAEGVTFSSYSSSVSGITDITTDGGVSVFPNPVVDVLNFSEPVDVIIYSLNGSVVKTASQVSTLNVTDLATGLYIVKAGDKAVRVIKK